MLTTARGAFGVWTVSIGVANAADTVAAVPCTGRRSLPGSGEPTVSPSPRSADVTRATSSADRAVGRRVLGRREVVAVLRRSGGGDGRGRLRQAGRILPGQCDVEVEDLPGRRRAQARRVRRELRRALRQDDAVGWCGAAGSASGAGAEGDTPNTANAAPSVATRR